jgi:hypothetical protein
MKKIISFIFLGLLVSSCTTTATKDDTTASSSSSAGAATPQGTQPDQAEIARQQIAAFEANQTRMYTQPVNN